MAKRKSKSTTKTKWGKYVLLLIAAIALIGGWYFFGPNTGSFTQGEYLYIHTGSDYNKVKQALIDGGFIRDINSFNLLAKEVNYPDHVLPGKYHIKKGMSNFTIVRMLKSGRKTPVKLTIRKVRTKQEFISMIGKNLEADSNVLKKMLLDTVYLAQFGLDTNTAMCGVMPDTYEFNWNTTADKAFRKIEKNYSGFWNEDRKAKAKALNLTPQQTIILASIVEEESNDNKERPTIASVYLNRLHKGMKLGADPTAKFAYGDFALRRVTSVQTSVASPYNTYYVTGLPIGPICTPSAACINAVLAAPRTTYLYFCYSKQAGGHVFANTYEEHQKNAQAYHEDLDNRNIH